MPPLVALLSALAGSAAGADATNGRGEAREHAEPAEFFYGGAVGIRREIYRDYDRRIVPIPIIGYRGDRLRVYGPFVNYDLLRAGGLTADVRLAPRFQGFDESDGDIFHGMDERESSLDLGLGVKYAAGNWNLELAGLRDALDRSNGREASLDLGRAFQVGKFRVEPAVGLQYLDSAHVDYYYGVEPGEATSFRIAYDGDSALNARLSITVVTPAYLGGLLRIGIERTWFDSTIEDSPLTDEDANLGVFIAFSKRFER